MGAYLTEDAPLTRRHLNAAIAEALGGSDTDDRWTQLNSFQILEPATAFYLRKHHTLPPTEAVLATAFRHATWGARKRTIANVP